jgi:hypothetical protein
MGATPRATAHRASLAAPARVQPPDLARDEPDPLMGGTPPRRAQAGTPPATTSRHTEPPRLLPPQAEVLRQPAPRPATGHGPSSTAAGPPPQAATAQETEVHIHIGRIEVTALHEAPRPAARPRERPQPVSLDAYLAARGKA